LLDSLIVWKLFGWELFGLLIRDIFAGELNKEENGKKNHKKNYLTMTYFALHIIVSWTYYDRLL